MSSNKISAEDKNILRELGKRKFEIGNMPVQQEKAQLWRDMNGLRPTRPLVWINEIPWHELAAKAPELGGRCNDKFLASVEGAMRKELYQWEHFACDMVVEPVVFCGIVGGPNGVYADYGIKIERIDMEGASDVLYNPIINSMDDVEKIKTPRVWYDKDETLRRKAVLEEMFDGIIPVQERGIVHQWHTPWDLAVQWYGVERLLFDMCDRPELVAAVARRVCEATDEVLDKQQELGMLDVGNGNWRVGSGGMGFCDELPEKVDGRPVTPADQWGCGNAQIFSEVSPAMHEEFSLQFERPVMDRFGLSYYGCCEPLHNKLDMLKTIKNLRKVSMSPKADLSVLAGGGWKDYVLSFKPNPAYLAPDTFRPDQVRQDVQCSVDKMKGHGMEIILKDITTVRSDPARLDSWADTVMSIVETV